MFTFAQLEERYLQHERYLLGRRCCRSGRVSQDRLRTYIPQRRASWLQASEANSLSLRNFRLKGYVIYHTFRVACLFRAALSDSRTLTYFSFNPLSPVYYEVCRNFYQIASSHRASCSCITFYYIVCFHPKKGCLQYYESTVGSLDEENVRSVLCFIARLYDEFNIFVTGGIEEIKTLSIGLTCLCET